MSHDPKDLTLDPVRKAGLIRSRGVPAVWSYVGVEEGILVGYPGVGEYPDDYEVRDRPWYTEVKADGRRTPHWGSLDTDESGLGLLFTATVGLYDDDGKFLGVAAMDIAFDHVVREMLDPKGLTVPVQTWLVAPDGSIVVDSSLKEVAGSLTEWKRTPFPYTDVLDAEKRGDQYVERDVDGVPRLFAWSRLLAVDFLYVVSAPTDDVVRGP